MWLVVSFCLDTKANGQGPFWTKIPLPNIYNKITPYFLNENVGFVFDATGTVQSSLRRTTDGGNTWAAIRFFDDANILINQIYFTDMNHGYAASSDGLYETFDNGTTWKNIIPSPNKPNSFNSIYSFDGTVFVFALSASNFYTQNWGPLLESSDDGATWDTLIQPTIHTVPNQFIHIINPMAPYVFGNRDGTVFAENILNDTIIELLYSTNNGKDWTSHTMDVGDKTFTMGFFPFPHCNDLIRTYISFVLDPKSDVYQITHSSDFGSQWNNLYQPFEIGAWIAGNNCVQYVCDAQGSQFGKNREGLWRSLDRGNTWTYINGPVFEEIDDGDFHNLSVVGAGAVIYAGDYSQFGGNGSLWKTTTGGDGTLSPSQFASKISILHELSSGIGDTLKLKVCDTGLVTMPFQNISCNYAQFQDVTIDGLDSSEFSTQLVHHLFCDGLPDTLLIHVVASSAGTKNITVHPHFINDEYETIDTSFAFILDATSASGTSIYLRSSSISAAAADTLEIPLYINNASLTPVKLGLDSIDFSYALNTDIVNPFIFIPSLAGITADPVTTTRSHAIFTLHFPPGFSFTGETELGKLKCEVYLSDTLETDISFTGNTGTSPCASILSSSTVHFSLTAHCGDSSLSKFIKDGTAFTLMSIVPNPASEEVRIELKNNSEELQYALYDALGILRKSGIVSGNSLQFNVADLPDGGYYVRIFNEGGMPITKRLVIAR